VTIPRPLVCLGVDPGAISGYGVALDDLKRDASRGYPVPYDWHWGRCSGLNGLVIQQEVSNMLDMVAAYYAAEWTHGAGPDEPKLVLRGTAAGETWIAYPDLHLYIEDQFIDAKTKDQKERYARQMDALKTATSKGRWAAIVETFGFITHEVLASVWREAQLGNGWGWTPRAAAKRHAVGVANELWKMGLKPSQDHTAEGRLIAEYGYVALTTARRLGTQQKLVKLLKPGRKRGRGARRHKRRRK
jgi:hypothetical protein